MRIVGGSHRNRAFVAPAGRFTRPTTDRLRETIFNILHNRGLVKGQRVLDVFAGSGALGMESLSRGASFAAFIEQNPSAIGVIAQNLEQLGLADRAQIFKRDAVRPGHNKLPPYDLAFFDPPYRQAFLKPSILAMAKDGWLAPKALLVLELAGDEEFVVPTGFELDDQRESGETKLILLQRV